MNQPTIQERRDQAASLLHDYSLHAKRSQSCKAADLLCDLMHWLDAEDLDIDDKIYQARRLYEQEVQTAEDAAKCATAHHVISDAEFLERFAPVKNHLVPDAPFDGCMFETFGPEFEHVRAQDPALIWTVIDCDGTLAIESGCHLVNRLGYLVASRPRLGENTYSVEDDADEPEDKTVAVSLAHLRAILDYLHGSEADHYDPETYPENVNDHVYAHVMAIEEQLDPLLRPVDDEASVPPSRDRSLITPDVLCELAHDLTARECGIRGAAIDAQGSPDDQDETRYTDEAQKVFEALHDIVSTVLEPYCENGGAR